MTIGPLTVFVAALITALATGLGALPLLFLRGGARRWLGVSNAAAAGFMAAAGGGWDPRAGGGGGGGGAGAGGGCLRTGLDVQEDL